MTAFLVFYGLLLWKTEKKLFSLLISLLIVFVGSEYYELPIFIRYGTSQWLHELNVLWMFILLVWFAKIRFSKWNITLLCFGPILTAPILFYSELTYLARVIGLTVLLIVTFNSPGVGGKTASKKPYRTSCLKLRTWKACKFCSIVLNL